MPSYLVETFIPRGAADHLAQGRAASAAAEALQRDGAAVYVGGSTYIPEDEICLFGVDAPSIADVERIAERAGLRLLRIVEAIPSTEAFQK
jgi:hypothetical protein